MLIFLLIAQAFASSPSSLVGFYPAEILRNEIVTFKPIAGHHFSLEAPQSCGSGSLSEKSPRALKCQFTRSGETVANLNVCDDKKTFCRPLQLTVKVMDQESAASPVLVKNQTINKELHRTLVPGFTEGHPEEIIKQAATRGQPVFVMVSTDWCPPCNEAKEFLLSSPTFQQATQNWFKIYVDGDSVEAMAWNKVVPYRFFPSFVLLNSRMQEIARYTGELRHGEFETWASEASGWVGDPVQSLKSRVVARRQGGWRQKLKDLWSGVKESEKHKQEERLLSWALDQDERELVDLLIQNSSFPNLEARILRYQIEQIERDEAASGKDLKSAKIATYTRLLAVALQGEHWAESLSGLCEVDVPTCKPFLENANARVQFLSKRSDLSEAEKESLLGDEYYYLAEAFSATGDKLATKDFALKCVDHFSAMKKRSFLKISRAGHQGMIACLEQAESYKKEEETLKSLIEAYPTEPTFLSRMARMYRKQKKFAQALPWIERAEAVAYGYNWINLEIMKADTYLELKKSAEAGGVLREALAQLTLDSSLASRNQSLVGKLRGLQARVSESQEK